MTYANEEVIHEISAHFVPCALQSKVGHELGLTRKLCLRWLPGLAVTDAGVRPLYTQVGYLSPNDLLADLKFVRGLLAIDEKKYGEAIALFRSVVDGESRRASDACYWQGIARERELGPQANYRGYLETWPEILARWPDSLEAEKVRHVLEAGSPQ